MEIFFLFCKSCKTVLYKPYIFFKCLEICIFCSVIQYIESKKQPAESVHEVLAESFVNCLWWSSFYGQFAQFSPTTNPPRVSLSTKWVIFPTFPEAEQLPKLASSKRISNSLSAYLPQFWAIAMQIRTIQ